MPCQFVDFKDTEIFLLTKEKEKKNQNKKIQNVRGWKGPLWVI